MRRAAALGQRIRTTPPPLPQDSPYPAKAPRVTSGTDREPLHRSRAPRRYAASVWPATTKIDSSRGGGDL